MKYVVDLVILDFIPRVVFNKGKVLRLQLELTQVKADIDRRLQEKDEEFESTRWA